VLSASATTAFAPPLELLEELLLEELLLVEPLLEDVLVLEEPLLLVLLVPLLLVLAVESPEEPPPPPPQATTSNEAAKTAVTREIERGIMRAPGGRCTYVASRIAIPHAITACCRKATRRIAGAVPPRLTFAGVFPGEEGCAT
jgi:hypothetical protein